ncbi:Flp pilus assembly protein CpaB [Fontivita pretiosa]|uniref:Flp pilus assembly protein CpaB n=1 Tax=Fontivita pretiosa TaxID=2989684 RepID=UPI003D180449
MSWKTWMPLVLAVVLGLVAMKVTRDVIARSRSTPARESGTPVVVVRSDIPAGTALKAEHLTLTRMSGGVSPQGVFSDPAQLEGRVVTVAMVAGQPVLEAVLAPRGAGNGLQALIPEGKRAMTVEINEFSGVAGNLTPGCRVDVVATISGDHGEMLSRTIVQNVKVQALGSRQQTDNDSAPIRSVTLIVTPKEAEAIELASATGRPRLVLRSGSDNDTTPTEGVTVAELRRSAVRRGDPFAVQPVEMTSPPATQPGTEKVVEKIVERVVEVPAAAPSRRQISVIRGGVETQTSVEDPQAMRSGGGGQQPRWMTGVSTQELPGAGTK